MIPNAVSATVNVCKPTVVKVALKVPVPLAMLDDPGSVPALLDEKTNGPM